MVIEVFSPILRDYVEMKIYFERQGRSSGGSRWCLYSLSNANGCTTEFFKRAR